MKMVSVYERRSRLFVRSNAETIDGVWIGYGPCAVLEMSDACQVIGDAVTMALEASRQGVPHPRPESWKSVSRAVLEAADVATWSTFARSARLVNVMQEGDLRIVPHERQGAAFMPLRSRLRVVAAAASSAAIGEAVVQSLAECV